MRVKNILAMFLAVVMMLSFAACSEEPVVVEDNDNVASEPTEPEKTEPEITEPAVEVKPLESFSMTITKEDGTSTSLIVYSNYDGTVHVDYVGDVIKRAEMDESVMDAISTAFAQSGVSALNNQYGEYDVVCGSFSASMPDGTYMGGEVYAQSVEELPAEFLSAYEMMDACFQELVKDVEEYIPEPMIQGDIAESDKAAIDGIMAGMNLPNADAFAIMGIMKDEFFAYTMGLSSDDNIVSGVQLAPMMNAQAYSLSIVTLAEGADTSAVAEDFKLNIDWRKWVCVEPDHALIAVKDNQVLILLGKEGNYDMTAQAIAAAGWTTYENLNNPNVG